MLRKMPVDPRTEYSTVCVTRDVSYYFLFLISQFSIIDGCLALAQPGIALLV
jgi:hypothetical protein